MCVPSESLYSVWSVNSIELAQIRVCAMLAPMRHTSRKRSAPDPLLPVDVTTWIVVRDRLSRVVESQELSARTDLRGVLNGERDARIAEGWAAEDIGARCAFFFAVKDGERVLIGIERIAPRDPLA